MRTPCQAHEKGPSHNTANTTSCGGKDLKRQEASRCFVSALPAQGYTTERYSAREMRRPQRGERTKRCDHRAATGAPRAVSVVHSGLAALVAVLQHCGIQGGASLAAYPKLSSPSCFINNSVSAFNQRSLLAQQQHSTNPYNINMSTAVHAKTNSDALEEPQESIASLALLDLPESPRKRQRAYGEHLIELVKARDAENALALYGMAEELGCRATENVFNAVLSLCDGQRVSQGVRVLADMRAAGFKPRENHYAFLLREAAGRGAFEEAFVHILDMVDAGVSPRLRSYTPLLRGLCSKPDMTLALEVWSHMAEQGVQPTSEEYVGMIKGWATAGELRQRVLDGSVDAFFRHLSSEAFELWPTPDESLSGVLDIGQATDRQTDGNTSHLQTLLDVFSGLSLSLVTNQGDGSSEASAAPSAHIASTTPEGACDCCGGRLGVVGLDAAARGRVREALIGLGSENAAGGASCEPATAGRGSTKLKEACDEKGGRGDREELWALGGGGGATGDLAHFAGWLEERWREGTHFSTVVDGCNIAYYRQNVHGGRFQISQVDTVVRLLEGEGDRVLVLLPDRYLRPVVPNSSRHKGVKNTPTTLSAQEVDIIHGWDERRMLYRCEDGADDDLFWMYFTVSEDTRKTPRGGLADRIVTTSEKKENDGKQTSGDTALRRSAAAGDGSSAGFPYVEAVAALGGGRQDGGDGGVGEGVAGVDLGDSDGGLVAVVSNDEMRNHRMALLEPVPFKRWRNSQVRGFHFPASNATAKQYAVGEKLAGTDGTDGKATGDERSDGRPSGDLGVDTLPEEEGTAPPPMVWKSPTFTRDMQVLDRVWHVPIRGEDGGPGDKWLCVDFSAAADSGESRQTEAFEAGDNV